MAPHWGTLRAEYIDKIVRYGLNSTMTPISCKDSTVLVWGAPQPCSHFGHPAGTVHRQDCKVRSAVQ